MSLSPLNTLRRSDRTEKIAEVLESKLIGQTTSITPILQRVALFEANLNDPGRPVGVFMMLGPTGTGKTRTVEVLAEALHGDPRAMIKIDCGEFQMEHEVARLIGAPPGYLGHRETKPVLSKERLHQIRVNERSPSIVLFDEIEKAAPSMLRLLLGITDRAVLTLGDNSTVDFSNTLIFFTSNLGADAMQKLINPVFGFESFAGGESPIKSRLEAIGLAAVRRKFSPEFVNRLDAVLTYEPLTSGEFAEILDLELEAVTRRIVKSGDKVFVLTVSPSVKDRLLADGISQAYGARHLKRAIDRLLVTPVSALVNSGEISRGDVILADYVDDMVQFFKIGEQEIAPEPSLDIPIPPGVARYIKKGKV